MCLFMFIVSCLICSGVVASLDKVAIQYQVDISLEESVVLRRVALHWVFFIVGIWFCLGADYYEISFPPFWVKLGCLLFMALPCFVEMDGKVPGLFHRTLMFLIYFVALLVTHPEVG